MIIAWAMARLWQIGAIALGLSVAVGSCALRDKRIEAKGAAKVVEASKQAGKVANAQAQKHHRAARTPGAAERLRKDSCRDC